MTIPGSTGPALPCSSPPRDPQTSVGGRRSFNRCSEASQGNRGQPFWDATAPGHVRITTISGLVSVTRQKEVYRGTIDLPAIKGRPIAWHDSDRQR
jgi:hypothetical protein